MHTTRWFAAIAIAVGCSAAIAAPAAPIATAAPAAPAPSLKGEVLEVADAGAYTYLRLGTSAGETWAAVKRTTIARGAQVTIDDPMVMADFQSRALNRRFDRIVLGTLGGAPAAPAAPSASPHGNAVASAAIADVRVAKATGRNARTVAEIVTRRTELKDQPVQVRGKVVKYTPGVMGTNWVHLRDGTGSAAERTHDVLVTTNHETGIGEVVTAQGTVRVDRNFGAGYAYPVLVEQATLRK